MPVGILLGTLAFLAATAAVSDDAFLTWGWRIPFLASALLFPVVLYIQTKVEDSPEFRELANEVESKRAATGTPAVVQAPLSEAIKSNWHTILLGCGLLAATNSLFYISIAGVLSYGTAQLGMDRDAMLGGSLVSTVIGVAVIVSPGIIVWAFPYFWLVNTAHIGAFVIAVSVGSVFQSMTYGPLAAYLGELFPPNVRLSGASLAYQLAAITVSGGTPFIMTAIIAQTGGTTLVSVFVALMGVVTFGSAWLLRETHPPGVPRR